MKKVILWIVYGSIIFSGLLTAGVVLFTENSNVFGNAMATVFVLLCTDALILASMFTPHIWLKFTTWFASILALLSSVFNIWFITRNYDYSYTPDKFMKFVDILPWALFFFAFMCVIASLYSLLRDFSLKDKVLKPFYWIVLTFGLFTAFLIFVTMLASALLSNSDILARIAVASFILFATIFIINIIAIVVKTLQSIAKPAQYTGPYNPAYHNPAYYPAQNQARNAAQQNIPTQNNVPQNNQSQNVPQSNNVPQNFAQGQGKTDEGPKHPELPNFWG